MDHRGAGIDNADPFYFFILFEFNIHHGYSSSDLNLSHVKVLFQARAGKYYTLWS